MIRLTVILRTVKYQLETIPVHDAWESDAPCPLCALMQQAEQRHVEYFLGNSVMNPETRVLVNKTGFCPDHFPMLREAGHAHHLGLIGHTHLQSVRSAISGDIRSMNNSGTVKSAAAFVSRVRKITDECLVCRSLARDLKRYCYTAVVIFKDDDEFRLLFGKSRGPCLVHSADLAEMASDVLKRKDLHEFLTSLASHIDSNLDILEADILRFTQKFDAVNDKMDWGSARDAHARTVQVLSGKTVRLAD